MALYKFRIIIIIIINVSKVTDDTDINRYMIQQLTTINSFALLC